MLYRMSPDLFYPLLPPWSRTWDGLEIFYEKITANRFRLQDSGCCRHAIDTPTTERHCRGLDVLRDGRFLHLASVLYKEKRISAYQDKVDDVRFDPRP